MIELAVRFVAGGLIVCLFSVTGELFKPESFSGIFGAAPSVALAGLSITVFCRGGQALVAQAHSMLFGAFALACYAAALVWVVRSVRLPTWLEAGAAWGVWLVVALGLCAVAF